MPFIMFIYPFLPVHCPPLIIVDDFHPLPSDAKPVPFAGKEEGAKNIMGRFLLHDVEGEGILVVVGIGGGAVGGVDAQTAGRVEDASVGSAPLSFGESRGGA